MITTMNGRMKDLMTFESNICWEEDGVDHLTSTSLTFTLVFSRLVDEGTCIRPSIFGLALCSFPQTSSFSISRLFDGVRNHSISPSSWPRVQHTFWASTIKTGEGTSRYRPDSAAQPLPTPLAMAAQPTPLAQQLLQRALSPDEADTRYERFLKRPLILRPTSPEPSARALRRRLLNEKKDKAKKRKALKPRPLSAAKKRQLGLLEIPKEQRKYTIYEPLHNLWLGYVRDILGLVATEGSSDLRWHVQTEHAGAMISSGDMHGALLEVVRSRSVSRVGLKGIVLRDSQYVFEIITKKDEIKSRLCYLIYLFTMS